MTTPVDPEALDCARRELEQPTLAATRSFVRGPCARVDPDGRPAPARALPTGAGGAIVWFLGAHYPLNLAVEVERDAEGGAWRVAFAQSDAHVRVALRISSEALAPDQVTAELGLAATREAPAGLSFDGRQQVARREHLWLRDVLPDSPAAIEEKLAALLALVEPHSGPLTELASAGRIRAAVAASYHADAGAMQGLSLSAGILARLGTLGLVLDLDLHAETLGTPPSAT